MFPFGALLFSSHLLIAVADAVPTIDVTRTCRNSASVTGTLTQSDIDVCIADEKEARDQLVKDWAQFSGASKAQCVHASTDYLPIYVEVLTCLGMSRDVKRLSDESETTARPSKQHRPR